MNIILTYNQSIDNMTIINFVVCILIQKGNTALHDAAEGGYTEIVDQLVSAGADVNIINHVSFYWLN